MTHSGLKDTAYDIIKEMLLKGKIKPGSRIREDLLAEELSMSRTPVREAINQLFSNGFVDIIPRKGVFAMLIDRELLRELTQVREALSILAVRECCNRITQEEIEELRAILETYRVSCLSDDKQKRCQCDGEYHKAIARLSGNSMLYQYLSEVEDKAIYSRNMEGYSYSKADSLSIHTEIFNAICAHDAPRAEKAIVENVRHLYASMYDE